MFFYLESRTKQCNGILGFLCSTACIYFRLAVDLEVTIFLHASMGLHKSCGVKGVFL